MATEPLELEDYDGNRELYREVEDVDDGIEERDNVGSVAAPRVSEDEDENQDEDEDDFYDDGYEVGDIDFDDDEDDYYDDEDDYYEDEDEIEVEVEVEERDNGVDVGAPSPRVSDTEFDSQVIVPADSIVGEGQGAQNREYTEGLDCPICYEPWSSSGEHQPRHHLLCVTNGILSEYKKCSCLTCGHLFGMSCIKKWLGQRRSSGKCPTCNKKSTLEDVRRIYVSQVVVADEKSQMRMQCLEAKCDFLEKKVLERLRRAEIKMTRIQEDQDKLNAHGRVLDERMDTLERAVMLRTSCYDWACRFRMVPEGYILPVWYTPPGEEYMPLIDFSQGLHNLTVAGKRFRTCGVFYHMVPQQQQPRLGSALFSYPYYLGQGSGGGTMDSTSQGDVMSNDSGNDTLTHNERFGQDQ